MRTEVAAKLLEIGGVKFGEFRLKLHERDEHAPTSPIYFDLRVTRSFPVLMDAVTDLFMEVTRTLRFDVLADVPTSATPIVAVLSHKSRVPMVSPRMRQKTYGSKIQVEGVHRPGQVALLLDDLVTQAHSKLEAIDVLESNALKVYDVVVLVDREQGGPQQLRLAGYNCHSVFKSSELLEIYGRLKLIPADQLARARTYLEMHQVIA